MGLSIGGSVPQSTDGVFTVDVRNYGMKAGGGVDNAPAIQAAHDALAAALDAANSTTGHPGYTGVLKFPAGSQPYRLGQPVWLDHGSIEVRGDGDGSVLQVLGGYNGPLFIAGLSRCGSGGNIRMTPAYRPDLHGVLDSTAAPAAGQLWGFRTNFDGYLLGQGCHFTHAVQRPGGGLDCYQSVNRLTVDFAYQIFTRTGNPISLAGMGNTGLGQGYPWNIEIYPGGVVYVRLGTQSAPFAVPSFTYPSFTVPGGDSGLHRVSFQIDLTAGTFTAWADGLQVAVTGGTLPAGGHLCENQYEPFVVGCTTSPGPVFGTQDFDFALYGLSVSGGLKYTPGAAGSLQARADARAINDQNRFFPNQFANDDPSPIGHLTFDENPTTITTASPDGVTPNVRGLSILGNNRIGDRSAVIASRSGQNTGGTAGHAIRDINLIGGSYGPVVGLAAVLTTLVERFSIRHGAYGIANLLYGANYPVFIRDGNFDVANDSSIFLKDCDARLRDITFSNAGRCPLRFAASNVDAQGMEIYDSNPNSEALVKIFHGDYGGEYQFRGLSADFEGAGASRCVLYAERTAYTAQSNLRCEDWNLNNTSGAPYLFELHDAFGALSGTGPLRLVASGIYGLATPSRAIVSVDGPRSVGELRDFSFTGGRPAAYAATSGAYGPGVNVRVVDDTMSGPPRAGSIAAGTARFPVRQPADGHYDEWRVIGSGTVNTANPPRLIGINPVRSSSLAAAGYAYDHTVFGTSILGGSASGSWLDTYLNGPTRALFGGGSYTPPASWNFHLSTGGTSRDGNGLNFPYGNGYAPAAVANNPTNFPAAAGGTKALAVAAAFPAPTGDWGTITCVVIRDTGNGFPVGMPLTTPVDVNAATGAISFPASTGFTIAHVPTNINGYLTTYGWSRLMDCVFGGQALGAPSTWYLGFSTTPANLAATVAEPVGNNYSRVAIPNDSAHWYGPGANQDFLGGLVANSQAVTPPTPSGSWGTITTVFLADAPSGGHIWAMLDLVTPITVTSAAPTVAPGALYLSLV